MQLSNCASHCKKKIINTAFWFSGITHTGKQCSQDTLFLKSTLKISALESPVILV